MTVSDNQLQSAILAPKAASIPCSHVNINYDSDRRARLLSEMQQLRGRVALREGAITQSTLDSSGRHVMEGDENSWHLLRLRGDGTVAGCARILVHPRNVNFPRLRIASGRITSKTPWNPNLTAPGKTI
jgi:hypothetical protein